MLIANRGEIAVRIARTLRGMGIRSVAVHAPGDSAHLAACDEAVEIASYLDPQAILSAARRAGAQAIHPGYGFLSQNADFAEACTDVVFIGPTPASMRRMANKHDSRLAAEKAGVPVIPGTGATDDTDEVVAAVHRVGLPVMLKAAAGGGGKGMRRIESADALAEHVDAAKREAVAAFGDGRILVEKLLTGVRHVEVQVMADTHGHVYALGERECSLQRRFQKIVEESPSPAVTPAIRAKLREAARTLAKASGYVNAGTVEFLLLPDGTFYFLEMNTRLQVEHPVTELVTGLDLVRLQVEVAKGARLSIPDHPPRGHAIEARIYAEDPERGFLPTTGRILELRWPEGIRVDHALRRGTEIRHDYDPMIAKVVAWGEDREQARQRLVLALRETLLLGVVTNLDWLVGLLETPEFVKGEMSVDRLPRVTLPELPPEFYAVRTKRGTDPWQTLGRWRVGESSSAVRIPQGIAVKDRGGVWIHAMGRTKFVEPKSKAAAAQSASEIRSPMTGKVVAAHVSPGDLVKAGQVLAIVTAMKMEFRIESPRDGAVESVECRAGELVDLGKTLVRLKE